MREIITDESGEKRFKQNRIINVLLDLGKLTIENIWCFYEYGMFSLEDLEEFFQLIGFSVKEYNQIKQFDKVPVVTYVKENDVFNKYVNVEGFEKPETEEN